MSTTTTVAMAIRFWTLRFGLFLGLSGLLTVGTSFKGDDWTQQVFSQQADVTQSQLR